MVKSLLNLMSWLLIGCLLLCSQSEASLLVDTTLDNDYKYTTHKFPSLTGAAVHLQLRQAEGVVQPRVHARDGVVVELDRRLVGGDYKGLG